MPNVTQSPSKGLEILAKVGLVAYGVLHLLIAYLALKIAFGGPSKSADNSGAFKELASTTGGLIALWVMVVGMLALVFWQLVDAFRAPLKHELRKKDAKKLAARAEHVGRAVVYGVIAFSAGKTAIGDGSSSSGKQKEATAGVLGLPGGPVLVVVAGVVILIVAGTLIVTGVKKKFHDDVRLAELPARTRSVTEKLGMVGYVAKGVAFGVVGVLVVIAGFTADPSKSGGLDSALKTLAGAPFGVVLLTVVALGIAAFGVFCFAWAKAPKLRQ